MKVLILTTSYPTRVGDPAGHFVETEARALTAAGHDVTVVAPGPPGEVVRHGVRMQFIHGGGAFGAPGVVARLRQRPTRALAVLRFLRAARDAIERRGSLDRIIVHFLVPSLLSLPRRSSAQIEAVGHGSDVRLLVSAPRALARRFIATQLARGVRFRFVSEQLRREAATVHPELARAVVAPPPVDVSGVPGRAAARLAHGVARDTRLVVVVGRLIPSKRVDVALGAATLIPGARVVCIGDGPERAGLEKRFGSVGFLGQLLRPEALAWIAASDLLVSASRLEGAPTVVREARALGVPVVAARAGDLDAWAERDRGIWVTP